MPIEKLLSQKNAAIHDTYLNRDIIANKYRSTFREEPESHVKHETLMFCNIVF